MSEPHKVSMLDIPKSDVDWDAITARIFQSLKESIEVLASDNDRLQNELSAALAEVSALRGALEEIRDHTGDGLVSEYAARALGDKATTL